MCIRDSFQSYAGLPADGVVGRDTWNAIQQAYEDVLEDLPEDYQQFAREIYPGRFIVLGDRGDTVLLLQQQLNRIAAQDPDIPTVAEDGIFGRGTDVYKRQPSWVSIPANSPVSAFPEEHLPESNRK